MTQPDLHTVRQAILEGKTIPTEQAQHCLSIARIPDCDKVFLKLTPEDLSQTAAAAHIAQRPLAGL